MKSDDCPVVGYYVHHHGSGHLHRAQALALELSGREVAVSGLSSLPRPVGWPGPWIDLPRDDAPSVGMPDPGRAAPTARERLHWAPRGHSGLLARQARVSSWLATARPAVVVVDVSVEVALLVRLHGVPVVSVMLPGRRGDAAHRIGQDVSDLLVGFWPPQESARVLAVPDDVRGRVQAVGALSRFPAESPSIPASAGPRRRVLVLGGSGGDAWSTEELAGVRECSPAWDWKVLGGTAGTWVADPREALREADVVLTHAGQNALAEVAALRRPAVVVPAERPHDEQAFTARALACGPWPVVVVPSLGRARWPDVLEEASRLDGRAWAGWCGDDVARRFGDLVEGLMAGPRVGPAVES